MKTKTIRQSATFRANPHEVYEMLMDSRKHAEFTGDKANISRKVGGKFTAYDGYVKGTNLSLVPDKEIVQSWRGYDWPKNHYSQAVFHLTKVKNGTRLNFTQSDVPIQHYKSISKGWKQHYWTPMRQILKQREITNKLKKA